MQTQPTPTDAVDAEREAWGNENVLSPQVEAETPVYESVIQAQDADEQSHLDQPQSEIAIMGGLEHEAEIESETVAADTLATAEMQSQFTPTDAVDATPMVSEGYSFLSPQVEAETPNYESAAYAKDAEGHSYLKKLQNIGMHLGGSLKRRIKNRGEMPSDDTVVIDGAQTPFTSIDAVDAAGNALEDESAPSWMSEPETRTYKGKTYVKQADGQWHLLQHHSDSVNTKGQERSEEVESEIPLADKAVAAGSQAAFTPIGAAETTDRADTEPEALKDDSTPGRQGEPETRVDDIAALQDGPAQKTDAEGQSSHEQLQPSAFNIGGGTRRRIKIKGKIRPAAPEPAAEAQSPFTPAGADAEREADGALDRQHQAGTSICDGASQQQEDDGLSSQEQLQTAGVNSGGGLKRRIRIKGKQRPAAETQAPLTPPADAEREAWEGKSNIELRDKDETRMYNGASQEMDAEAQLSQEQLQSNVVNIGGLKRRIRTKGKARPAAPVHTTGTQTPFVPAAAADAKWGTIQTGSTVNRQGEPETRTYKGATYARGVDGQWYLMQR
jgi:hypothetical protein